VQVSAIRRVDVQLQVATVNQAIEVLADQVVLQTDKADIHADISPTEVEDLPYNGSEGRNFQALLLLQPGANTTAGTGEANSAAGNPQRAITVSPNGISSQANNTRLDDAINNYFTHPGRLAKNIQNQYGFAIGGPVWIPKIVHGKNKLFWFMDYENTRQSQFATTPNLTLPTAAMRTGDFSAISTIIYDPLTGNADGTGRIPFPNNTIPSNRIAFASATLTALLPALTRPTALTSNYDAYVATTYNVGRWDWKVNYNPNEKSMIWGRYSVSPMDIVAPLVLGPAGGDAFNGGEPSHAGGPARGGGAGPTDGFPAPLLLDGNAGYTRQNI